MSKFSFVEHDMRALADRLDNVHKLAADELRGMALRVEAMRRQHNQDIRDEQRAAREDARDVAAEATWKARQGDEYGGR